MKSCELRKVEFIYSDFPPNGESQEMFLKPRCCVCAFAGGYDQPRPKGMPIQRDFREGSREREITKSKQ